MRARTEPISGCSPASRGFDTGETFIYYEVTTPNKAPQFRPIGADLKPGATHEIFVLEVKKNTWRVKLDGKWASPEIVLPESHGKFKPQLLGESWSGSTGKCNQYQYEFNNVQLASATGGSWVKGKAGYIFKDAQTKKLSSVAFSVRATASVKKHDLRQEDDGRHVRSAASGGQRRGSSAGTWPRPARRSRFRARAAGRAAPSELAGLLDPARVRAVAPEGSPRRHPRSAGGRQRRARLPPRRADRQPRPVGQGQLQGDPALLHRLQEARRYTERGSGAPEATARGVRRPRDEADQDCPLTPISLRAASSPATCRTLRAAPYGLAAGA